jgi:TRAP transporter TAXI family solute receptor
MYRKFRARYGPAIFLVATALFATACNGAPGSSEGASRISIASGDTSGTYYAYAGAYANILSKTIEGINANAESTGGSQDNVKLVAQGDVTVGITQVDVAFNAVNGAGDFSQPLDLRAIGVMYPNYLQLVARADSGISVFDELKDRDISVGPAGGGQEVTLRAVTSALGTSFDEFGEVSPLSLSEQNNAIRNRQIEVGNYMTSVGSGALQDLTSTEEVNFVTFTPEQIDKITSQAPYFTSAAIPAGTYPGIDEEVPPIPTLWNILVVSAEMDDDLAYKLTRALYESQGELKNTVPVASATIIDNIDKAVIPLHPGSARYVEEAGAKTSK